jgi:GNAT superfamily N-acetyltransferase
MITIRKAIQADIPDIIALVKELALFEKAPEEVTVTAEDYLQNGFKENSLFDCNLAYFYGELAGFSLWYFRFSTWKGKRLYLEDLYVREPFRGKGIGKILLNRVIDEAKVTQCSGLMWQVLEWNEPAIEFYKKYNAQLDGEWINVNLSIK